MRPVLHILDDLQLSIGRSSPMDQRALCDELRAALAPHLVEDADSRWNARIKELERRRDQAVEILLQGREKPPG